jgi:mannose-6-phosphate isomerase-like protein (cupin superfamily)
MSSYAIKNFGDIESTAPEGLVAKFSRKFLDSDHLGISYFEYGPGFRSGMGHRHREQEEAYIVIAGAGRIKLDDEIVELKQWDVVRVAPNVARAFEAGSGGMTVIAVGNDRPEGGDGERIDDFWVE